jgi:hypothetical protein
MIIIILSVFGIALFFTIALIISVHLSGGFDTKLEQIKCYICCFVLLAIFVWSFSYASYLINGYAPTEKVTYLYYNIYALNDNTLINGEVHSGIFVTRGYINE